MGTANAACDERHFAQLGMPVGSCRFEPCSLPARVSQAKGPKALPYHRRGARQRTRVTIRFRRGWCAIALGKQAPCGERELPMDGTGIG